MNLTLKNGNFNFRVELCETANINRAPIVHPINVVLERRAA